MAAVFTVLDILLLIICLEKTHNSSCTATNERSTEVTQMILSPYLTLFFQIVKEG